ncbi:MAG: hypothetical protein QNK04_08295 [Myxococcota bacterium]|nr:hypothetical protein [Myxococcota bacterium]
MSGAGPDRHLPWLVALLVVAAVPVLLATFRPGRWDDCADPEALRDVGRLLEGTATRDDQAFLRRHLFQRHEATLPAVPGLHPLRVRVVRSDEVRYPFDQQTKFLKVPMDPERSEVRWVDAPGGRVPIHLVYANQAGAIRVVASLFVYDGQPVDSLLRMQIRSAPRQLMAGRRPITLFQVDGFGPPRRQAQLEDAAIAWVLSGWRAYGKLCRPAEQAAAGA